MQDRDANNAFKCFDVTARDPLIHEFCHQKSSATDNPEPKDSTTGHNIPTDSQKHESIPHDASNTTPSHGSAHDESVHNPTSSFLKSVSHIFPSSNQKVIDKPKRRVSSKQPTIWGRASVSTFVFDLGLLPIVNFPDMICYVCNVQAKKNLSMKSKDLPSENECVLYALTFYVSFHLF